MMQSPRLLTPALSIQPNVSHPSHTHGPGRVIAHASQSHHERNDSTESEEDGHALGPSTSHLSHRSLQIPGSPTAPSLGGQTVRSRGDSFRSTAETTRSRALSDVPTLRSRFEGDDLTTEEALSPDPVNEADFIREDNPFAFSPGQLNKCQNPKSLAAFRALGGIRGLEKGLQTDSVAGLSVDETSIQQRITFEDATRYAQAKKATDHSRPLVGQDVIVSDHEVQDQYRDRKRIFGDNRLPAKKTVSIWRLFWNAYNDRVLIILTIAAVISLALGVYEAVGQSESSNKKQGCPTSVETEGSGPSLDWVEGLAIEIAVIVVVLVTGLNDYRREKQFVALNAKKDDRLVKAVRSGKSIQISVFDVQVGDVLHLESGDSIPADGVLISGHGIRCDESSATGESDAMKKTAGEEVWQRMVEGTATSKLDPFIISGSKVLEGVGKFLVTSVGTNSSFGKIMVGLQTENESTPLQAKLGRMANAIGYLGTSAASLLFFVLLIRFLVGLSSNTATSAVKGSQFLDIFIVAVTIIVVAIPEGLPLAVTLALSFATKRMLKDNNLVRRLRACETMGNATTVCSDKTGTLTQNRMTVVSGLLGTRLRFGRDILEDEKRQEVSFHPSAASEEKSNQLSSEARTLFLQSCVLNSTAFEGEEDGKPTFIGSKTETAILIMAKEHLGLGLVAEERSAVEVAQLFPFDSDRKCMGIVFRLSNGNYRFLVKGAAEILLANATDILADLSHHNHLETEPMSSNTREHLATAIETFANHSLRTIAMVYRDFESWPPSAAERLEEDQSQAEFSSVFHSMTMLAIVGIEDPLREGVSLAVQHCQSAGVYVRMVTGDNIATATAIATQCGIKTSEGVSMEGPVFRRLSENEMDAVIPKLQVLARSSPDDKRILVARLKALGETVAVTGDGTNDGPALKTADVGFSMGIAGTEVAKEASAIILMDDNFSSIVSAIMWGRSVNDAVAKFLQFQLTVNITAVTLAFVSAVASPDSHSVLSAVQLLWVNLIMDTFAALALATDAPTSKILNRKPSPKSAPLITTNMWKMIIGQAVYQLAVTFVLYFAGARILGYNMDTCTEEGVNKRTELNTIVFNTFVWMQIFNEFNNRRLDNKFNIFEGVHKNWFFIIINCIMVGGQTMIVFVGGKAFQIKRIDGPQWAICILCALPCLLWAIVLRCIPDKYAAMLFRFTGRVWDSIFAPIVRFLAWLFKPVGRAMTAINRAVFSPAKRILLKPFKKGKETEEDGPTSNKAEGKLPENHGSDDTEMTEQQMKPHRFSDEETALGTKTPTPTTPTMSPAPPTTDAAQGTTISSSMPTIEVEEPAGPPGITVTAP